jgi:hypothetical protein
MTARSPVHPAVMAYRAAYEHLKSDDVDDDVAIGVACDAAVQAAQALIDMPCAMTPSSSSNRKRSLPPARRTYRRSGITTPRWPWRSRRTSPSSAAEGFRAALSVSGWGQLRLREGGALFA